MLSRKERIDRKSQLLKHLDPEREVELEGTFANHVVDAIRASSPTERQQAIDKATEAYEDALDSVLYEYGRSTKLSSLISFNTNITHLSDVPRSSQELRGWLEKAQLARSGRG